MFAIVRKAKIKTESQNSFNYTKAVRPTTHPCPSFSRNDEAAYPHQPNKDEEQGIFFTRCGAFCSGNKLRKINFIRPVIGIYSSIALNQVSECSRHSWDLIISFPSVVSWKREEKGMDVQKDDGLLEEEEMENRFHKKKITAHYPVGPTGGTAKSCTPSSLFFASSLAVASSSLGRSIQKSLFRQFRRKEIPSRSNTLFLDMMSAEKLGNQGTDIGLLCRKGKLRIHP